MLLRIADGLKTTNGRIYPRTLWEEANKVCEQHRMFVTIGSEGPSVNLDAIAAKVDRLATYSDGDSYYVEAMFHLMSTPKGAIVGNLLGPVFVVPIIYGTPAKDGKVEDGRILYFEFAESSAFQTAVPWKG